MNTTDLMELVQRGDPKAIAQLLNAQTQNKDFFVKVIWQNDVLHVLLELGKPLDRRYLVNWVQEAFLGWKLDLQFTVNVYGQKAGQSAMLWQDSFDLAQLAPPQPAIDDLGGTDHFIVCGLGSLGQYCVLNLRKFASQESEIRVAAIDRVYPDDWEIENLPDWLAGKLIIGDCRREEVLERAGIKQARAILLVTSDEAINIETAIAARRLNPKTRLVVRSSRQNLNELLEDQLGNFAAFEPTALAASPFSLAGLGEKTIGFFNIQDFSFRVNEELVRPGDSRFDGFPAYRLHKKNYRLLSCLEPLVTHDAVGRSFFQWKIDDRVKAGDQIAYIEVDEHMGHIHPKPASSGSYRQILQDLWQALTQHPWQQRLSQLREWYQANQTRQVIGLGVFLGGALWLSGTLLLKFGIPNMRWQQAISAGIILLLGGYGDLFGGLEASVQVPWWVQSLCFLITIVSLLFVLGVLGLIADNLLSSRFEFLHRRPAIPRQDHIILIGFKRLGQRVAALMQEVKQPTVVMEEQIINPSLVPPQLPLVVGNLFKEISRVNLAKAKSIILVTEDQMLNLELGLTAQEMAKQMGHRLNLVIRTYTQRFSDELANLLPDARALCAHALGAEAFAGAAFGENMLSLFRLNNRTILVTEYIVEPGDTLIGKLLAQISYGYRVVPVFYQRPGYRDGLTMPSDNVRLAEGDRLVVLSSINGLKRIEQGELIPADPWRLTIEKTANANVLFDAGNCLENISGCGLTEARTLMQNLPGSIDLYLYEHQAHRLEQEMKKLVQIVLTRLEQTGIQ